MYFSKKIIWQYFFVFCFIIISFRFFYYVGFPDTIRKLPQFLLVPFMFYICWKPLFIWKSTNSIFLIIRWIIFSLIVSIISAWVFWEQPLSLGFRASSIMFTLLFFFYLCKRCPSVSFLESVIWTVTIIYIILWIYAFFQAPTPVFLTGAMEKAERMGEDLSRGIVRIAFEGRIFLPLAFFMALNKFYVTRKKFFLFSSLMFFYFIILHVTRQIIVWSAFVAMIYIYLKNPKKTVLAIFICIVTFFVLMSGVIKFSDDSIIGSLINISQDQFDAASDGEENIRITEYKYFFFDWSKNIITDIIGNGRPHETSTYGAYELQLRDNHSLYLSDVGYADMYVVQGLLGLLLYTFLFYKTVRIQMPANLDYVRMFMAFMILANIAASWYTKADAQIAISISAYLVVRYGRNQRNTFLKSAYTTCKNENY